MAPVSAPSLDPVRNRALGLLLVVYIFNFVDRQIIGILAGPIKAELGLSDLQLGLMGGLAFALFYTGLGIPIAWAADRYSRTRIIGYSLAIWSGFTALCGLAQGFWQLFLCRMGVGIGEAGGVAPSYSLIADYFPKAQRARALAVFSFGIPIGSALGIYFGGWIASTLDWRWAFGLIGAAGLLFVPVFRALVPEPPRGRYDGDGKPATPAPFAQVLRVLATKPAFWLLAFGAACGSILNYGLIFWLPSFFTRSFGLALGEVGLFYGTIVLVGGLIGIWGGGWLGDRLGAARPGAFAAVPAIAFALAIPCYALGLTSTSLVLGFVLFVVPQALGLAWLGPILSAIQHLVPATMRATASAVFLFINNLIGIGGGTVVLGWLSETLSAQYGAESLRYAMLYGLVCYAASAALFGLAARRLARDWHHDAA